MELLEEIKKKDAKAYTHGGKFHADDVFSAALLLYINPEIVISRGNKVPEDFDGIVFDIGRGRYDHHQKDSRVRENGVPYAAFGLLWEALGKEILGEELAEKLDESFIQPLDINDNTGEKNELATLIGNFNPPWDAKGGSDEAFFQAVSVAGMILENKFERYRGNARADQRVEQVLEEHNPKNRILVLPEFIPCQKALDETEIAFVIFPSNRGGYCIQPQKREYSMNYKCSFPSQWLGLEGAEELLKQIAGARGIPSVRICHVDFAALPELEIEDNYAEVALEKQDWKARVKEQVRQILKYKPEAVYVQGNVFETYPMVHALRKKHIPVLTMIEKAGRKLIVRIPSGS